MTINNTKLRAGTHPAMNEKQLNRTRTEHQKQSGLNWNSMSVLGMYITHLNTVYDSKCFSMENKIRIRSRYFELLATSAKLSLVSFQFGFWNVDISLADLGYVDNSPKLPPKLRFRVIFWLCFHWKNKYRSFDFKTGFWTNLSLKHV